MRAWSSSSSHALYRCTGRWCERVYWFAAASGAADLRRTPAGMMPCAVLCCAVLCRAVPCCAVLCCAPPHPRPSCVCMRAEFELRPQLSCAPTHIKLRHHHIHHSQEAPGVLTGNQEAGSTLTTAFSFRLSKAAALAAASPSPPPAVQLLARYFAQACSDENVKKTFKMIGRARNYDELGLPSWMKRFNGKPVIINHSGEVFTGNSNGTGSFVPPASFQCRPVPPRAAPRVPHPHIPTSPLPHHRPVPCPYYALACHAHQPVPHRSTLSNFLPCPISETNCAIRPRPIPIRFPMRAAYLEIDIIVARWSLWAKQVSKQGAKEAQSHSKIANPIPPEPNRSHPISLRF